MKLNEVLARAPAWYGAGLSVFLRSSPGRGKTATVLAVPALLAKLHPGKSFGISVVNGAGLSETDATGYLVPVKGDPPTSRFTEPFWMRTSEGKHMRDYDGGILFVDEADKAPLDVKKILGEAAESGRFASHRLPAGWVVWMAGNRSTDRSGSTKELDHLINRRMEIEITDDVDSLVHWMESNGASPETITFATENPTLVFTEGVPKVQGPWCTPRALMKVDTYIQALASMSPDGVMPTDATTIEEVGGIIGPGAATQFFAMIRLGMELPPVSEIVKDPMGVKVPRKADAQMLTVYKLAHAANRENADALTTFMGRKEMPKEFAVTFLRAITKRDPKFIVVPAVQKWCMKNAALVAIVGKLRDAT